MSSIGTGAVADVKILLKAVVTDLQTFGWKSWMFTLTFAVLTVIFSFIDFNKVLGLNDDLPSIFTWENDKYFGFNKRERICMSMSGAASFTGAMAVVLTAKQKLSSYFWGIINSVLYGLFAWVYGYSGDAQLHLFYFLPLQFVGIYCWIRKLDDTTNTVTTQSLSPRAWVSLFFFSLAVGVAFYYEIPAFSKWLKGSYAFENNIVPHLLDTVSTTFNVVAQVLMIMCCWQQWFLWIAVNCVQIAMFSGVAGYGINFNILSMWCLYLLNGFYGLRQWRSQSSPEKERNNPDIAETTENSDFSESDVMDELIDL